MPEKILYILGAGASAKALPLSKEIKERDVISLPMALKNMRTTIKNSKLITSVALTNFFNKVTDDLEWLANEGESYSTVDTYAKFLFINDKNKYERLKYILSIYFTLEQNHNKKLDKRYLVWLTSVLEYKNFPENIKIISWNYDFQMELTAEMFLKEKITRVKSGTVSSGPLIQYYPSLGQDLFQPGEISLLHLNGIAGFYKEEYLNYHAFVNHEYNNNHKYLAKLMEHENYSRLHFAWEKGNRESVKKLLFPMVKDTTIVVVIGYSFPFFNREMDKEVYNALMQTPSLKKIYFQDPFLDGSFLRNQFGYEKEKIAIEHVQNTEAFYIPFEL